jgi:rhodanese-related sulfurtransferase
MKSLIIGCCMVFSFFCCAKNQDFISLSPADFEKLLKENPDIQLVDVRRPEEFEAGYIDKSLLINVQEADFIKKAKTLLDKSKPVAVYCRSGKRSKDAATKLTKEGFKVYELDSGYLGWVEYQNSK